MHSDVTSTELAPSCNALRLKAGSQAFAMYSVASATLVQKMTYLYFIDKGTLGSHMQVLSLHAIDPL